MWNLLGERVVIYRRHGRIMSTGIVCGYKGASYKYMGDLARISLQKNHKILSEAIEVAVVTDK